jgi:hypothetical protein
VVNLLGSPQRRGEHREKIGLLFEFVRTGCDTEEPLAIGDLLPLCGLCVSVVNLREPLEEAPPGGGLSSAQLALDLLEPGADPAAIDE